MPSALRLLSMVVLFSAFGLVARAQPNGARAADSTQVAAMLDQQVEQLTERLALTAEQQEQVRVVLVENLRATRQIRRTYAGMGREARQTMMQELRTRRSLTEEAIEAILDDEQRAAYAAQRGVRQQRGL